MTFFFVRRDVTRDRVASCSLLSGTLHRIGMSVECQVPTTATTAQDTIPARLTPGMSPYVDIAEYLAASTPLAGQRTLNSISRVAEVAKD